MSGMDAMTRKKIHGNVRYPELHDKERLEALVKRYCNAERIAEVLGCNPRTVMFAMEKSGVKPLHYCVRQKKEG